MRNIVLPPYSAKFESKVNNNIPSSTLLLFTNRIYVLSNSKFFNRWLKVIKWLNTTFLNYCTRASIVINLQLAVTNV